jgi:hypothetical protein
MDGKRSNSKFILGQVLDCRKNSYASVVGNICCNRKKERKNNLPVRYYREEGDQPCIQWMSSSVHVMLANAIITVLSKQLRGFPVKNSKDPNTAIHSAACSSLICELIPALYLGLSGLIQNEVPWLDFLPRIF